MTREACPRYQFFVRGFEPHAAKDRTLAQALKRDMELTRMGLGPIFRF